MKIYQILKKITLGTTCFVGFELQADFGQTELTPETVKANMEQVINLHSQEDVCSILVYLSQYAFYLFEDDTFCNFERTIELIDEGLEKAEEDQDSQKFINLTLIKMALIDYERYLNMEELYLKY